MSLKFTPITRAVFRFPSEFELPGFFCTSPGYTNKLCGNPVAGSDVELGTRRTSQDSTESDQEAILAGRSLFV